MNSCFFPKARHQWNPRCWLSHLDFQLPSSVQWKKPPASWATQSNNQDIQSRGVILPAIATMGKQPPSNTWRLNPIRCIWPWFLNESPCCQWTKFFRSEKIHPILKCFYHPSWDESVSEGSCCWAEWLQTPVMLHVQKPMLHPIHSSQPSQ